MKGFLSINDTTRIDLPRLLETRLLLQANSGGGKSWAIRRLAEQAAGQVQTIIIDLEGEFASLREKYDFILAGKGGDTPADPRSAELLARRLLELRGSAIIDLYELHPQERKHFVKLFLDAMMNAPKELWHPCLVIVDEAHVFCPEKGDSEAMGAVIDLMTRGRKRGFCGVLATQRISKLHKDAAAECNNKMIGRSSQDIDMKRASEELGFTSKTDMLSLRDLEAGEFFVFGPAISRTVERTRVGNVSTSHARGGAVGLRYATPPKPTKKILALLPKLADLPKEAATEARTVATLTAEIRALKAHRCPAVAVDERAITLRVEAALKDAEARARRREAELVQSFKASSEFIAEIVRRGAKLVQSNSPPKPIDPPQAEPSRRLPPPPPTPSFPPSEPSSHTLPRQAAHILGVLCSRHPTAFTRPQLATLSGVSAKSSTYANSLSILNVAGLITKNGDVISASATGLELNGGASQEPRNPYEVRTLWRQKLPGGAAKLFEALEAVYPVGLSREMLAANARMSPTSSSFANYLSMLNTNGLIVKSSDEVRLSPSLYD